MVTFAEWQPVILPRLWECGWPAFIVWISLDCDPTWGSSAGYWDPPSLSDPDHQGSNSGPRCPELWLCRHLVTSAVRSHHENIRESYRSGHNFTQTPRRKFSPINLLPCKSLSGFLHLMEFTTKISAPRNTYWLTAQSRFSINFDKIVKVCSGRSNLQIFTFTVQSIPLFYSDIKSCHLNHCLLKSIKLFCYDFIVCRISSFLPKQL